jgi:hypothetical protein
MRRRIMLKEVELEYTVSNLVKLSRDKWGDNAVEYLAGALDSVITYNQMKVLIDFLSAERTNE